MKISINCPTCGKEFQVHPSRARQAAVLHCSLSCYNVDRRERPHVRIPAEERFWKYVRKTDHCWIWEGGKDSKGYGVFGYDHLGRSIGAHKFSYEIHKGPVPSGMFVCHNCLPLPDNPSCVNPDHLFLGTHKENMRDGVSKESFAKGEDVYLAKLTADKVREMRALHATGKFTHQTLSDQFGVTPCNIGKIVRGELWRHVV